MYKKLFSIAAVAATALFASSPALARHRGHHHSHSVRVATTIMPAIVAGNPANCAALGYPGATTLFDSGKSGTVTAPGVSITVATSDGITFDFSASFSAPIAGDKILAVFAKGGNQGGNLYAYPNGVLADTGLHPPLTGNNGNGGFASISHLLFCYGTVSTNTPTPTPNPNTPPNTTTTPGVTVTAPSLSGTAPTTQHKAPSKKKVKAKKVKHTAPRRARQRAGFTG